MTDKVKFSDLSAEEQALDINVKRHLTAARTELEQLKKYLDTPTFITVVKMFSSWLTGPKDVPAEIPQYKTVVEIFENLDRLKVIDPVTFKATLNLIEKRYEN